MSGGTVWEFLEDHRERLLEYCRLLCPDLQQAEDLLHDAALRVQERFDPARSSGDAALMAYLKQTVLSLWLNRLRREKRSRTVPLEELAQPLPDPRGGGLPDDETVMARHFIQSLPPRLREVAELYTYQDLTTEEIAQRLSLSAGTVRGYLAEIRRRGRIYFGLTEDKEDSP